MKSYLAIDIGSNTIKCLLAERHSDGKVDLLWQYSENARISDGCGGLVPNAAEIVSDCVEKFREGARGIVKNFSEKAVATSALREAVDGNSVAAKIFDSCGAKIFILSESEEAALSYEGAMTDPDIPKFDASIFFDLGGGSIEFVAGACSKVNKFASFPLGAVRLTKLYSGSDAVADADALRAMSEYCRSRFDNFSVLGPLENSKALIGTGGALSAARRLAALLNGRDSALVDVGDIERILSEIAPMPVSERARKYALPESRADILPAAFVCILEASKTLGYNSIWHTYRNLRYGLVSRWETIG